MFQKQRVPVGSGVAVAVRNDRADELSNQPARLPDSNSVLVKGTNRPGAVLSREAEDRAAELNNQAMRLLEAGDAKGAIPLFEQALALNPRHESLHYNLGNAYDQTGDATNAEHHYQEALKLLPDFPDAHNNYGILLFNLGRLAEAEDELTEAVEQLPESAAYRNNLGMLQQQRQETNQALLCFQKAIQCDSNYWQAHFNLARAYLLHNNREKAIAELRAAQRIKPGFQPIEQALAFALGRETPPGSAGGAPSQ
jgi:Flp pilus assembly protein TadD